jgi:hypothetical protein
MPQALAAWGGTVGAAILRGDRRAIVAANYQSVYTPQDVAA